MQVLVNLDYKREQTKIDKDSNQELTLSYIEFAVGTKYKDGMSGSQRRIFGRIQRKLDEAVEQKADYVDLEQAELDIIKASFKDAKFPPTFSKYVVILESYLEDLKADVK